MAKFPLSLTFAEFEKCITPEGKKLLVSRIGQDDLEFVFGCLRMGYMNKMHHKDKQMRDRADLAFLRHKMQTDPEFKKKMEQRDKDRLD